MLQHSKIIERIRILEELLGIKLYLVGGAVRNIILDYPTKDLDFASSSHPDEIEKSIIAAGYKPLVVGKKYGTIGMEYQFDGIKYKLDITTFRLEKYASISRKPAVEFTQDLELDLARRDFTMNAIALNSSGDLFDNFNGREDIKNGVIKAVGDPESKFADDPLRMLRAIRFAADLDFNVEQTTWEAICKSKFSILDISKERWVGELEIMLSSVNSRKGLNLLMDSGLLGVMFPEMKLQKNFNQNTPYHDFTLWEHTLNVVENVPQENLNLRWTAFLHDVAKPFTRVEKANGFSGYAGHEVVGAQMALKICNYLKFSKVKTEFIVETIKYHLTTQSPLKKYDDAGKKVKLIT